mmetsp:Transcript_40416/g.100311  ORF Transcript_40416/g.100311 Transcript_40416/m.100311 type:complete len:82 (-) Transcript_40416:73-318(-)
MRASYKPQVFTRYYKTDHTITMRASDDEVWYQSAWERRAYLLSQSYQVAAQSMLTSRVAQLFLLIRALRLYFATFFHRSQQ